MGEGKIVVAIDSELKHNAVDLARSVSDYIYAVKVNWPLILERGIGIVKELSSITKVICDLKLADIPNTNRLIAEKIISAGGFAIIAHAFCGTDSLKAVKFTEKVRLISVIAMTHPGGDEYINGHWEKLLKTATEAGSYGIIAPGNNPVILSRVKKSAGELKIFSPGIGTQGGDPVTAIKNGADFIIVGRTVYDSDDPVSVVSEMRSRIGSYD